MATINESLRDESIAHSVWLSRYATGVANRMVKLLNETDADLSARLLDALDRLPPESFTVNQASYAFGGVTNTTAQGNPVPLLYGRRRIGGAIISAGIYVEDQQ